MEKIIATIKKNAREEVRVGLTEYKGHDLLSLRIWADDGANVIPTPKGINIAVRLLPEIRAALDEAEAEARREGLL